MKKRGELFFILSILLIISMYSAFDITPRYEKYTTLEEIEKNSQWETVEITINDHVQVLNVPVERDTRLSKILGRVVYTYKEAQFYDLPKDTNYHDLQRYKANRMLHLPGKSHYIEVRYVVG